MLTILYFLLYVFTAVTYLILTIAAVTIGVRQGILAAASIIVPAFLESLAEVQKQDDDAEDIMSVLDDEANGKISSEEAKKILRNIRGEA